MKEKKSTDTAQSDRSRITPQQQLWASIEPSHQEIVRKVFRRIKKRDQEDLCCALVAFIRYRIVRKFNCPFMQTLFETLMELILNKYVKPDSKKQNV
ncbi:MAG: hypothetical protein MJZ73_12125 [Bacteroidaceae bacterium]|nr:hypothetical protein [Bacteroidaceae bacterium]